MTNSYTKLQDGSWGVRVVGTVNPGTTVKVQTKAGSTKTEVVSRVLWSGKDRFNPSVTVSLCRIAQGQGGDAYGNRIANGRSYQAGVIAPHGRKCPECGSRECSKAWNPSDLCDND